MGEAMNNTREEKERFATVMWGLAEDFGGKITSEGLKIRFMALEEYTIDQITQAATWLLKYREKTFPAVPTTKEIIGVIQNNGAAIDYKSAAEVQVDVVLKKLKFEGRTGEIDFDDRITRQLMSVRWPYHSWAASVMEKDLVWFRKEFVEAYQAYGSNEKQLPLLNAPDNVLSIAQNLSKKMQM
jgi:hypothetical protein